MRVSFLGLGNMGMPLAVNILKTGMTLTIFSSSAIKAEKFAAKGALVADSILDLANCDILCTCLPLPTDVLDVAMRRENLHELMLRGSVHLEMSTIGPDMARVLQSNAKKYGIGYVQATVSKTPAVAAKGEAPFFVGGDPADISRVMPLLEKIGKPRDVHTVVAACAVKLISNLIGMSNIAVLAEGLRIGQLAGMDLGELLDLLLDTGAASFQMKTRGPMIIEGDFRARFSVDLAAKDLRLGCAMARELGYEPKMMGQALACLQEGQLEDLGDEDVCALFKIASQSGL